MRFLGSKARVWKHIAPTILHPTPKMYVEPFCGGCNSLCLAPNPRIGADVSFTLIAMWNAVVYTKWTPPRKLNRRDYVRIRDNPEEYEPALVGFVAYGCSFGGKQWAGYARGGFNADGAARNHCRESRDSVLSQAVLLQGTAFVCCDYRELKIPTHSTVYCDPPYGNTKHNAFDTRSFWVWARALSSHSRVWVSGYRAPLFWKTIWKAEKTSNLARHSATHSVEKLFKWGRVSPERR